MRIGTAAGIAICLLGVAAIQGCAGLATVATGAAAGVVATDDRRTPGTYVDDGLIEINVRSAIAEDETLKNQTHINATSYNGVVLLTGEAPGESLRARVIEITRRMSKVRRIHNEIALKAPSTLLERTADTVVTGQVKASLFGAKKLNPGRIKVVTERKVVYLMGLLTEDEANRAIDIARRVPSVQRVVNVIEYIE